MTRFLIQLFFSILFTLGLASCRSIDLDIEFSPDGAFTQQIIYQPSIQKMRIFDSQTIMRSTSAGSYLEVR